MKKTLTLASVFMLVAAVASAQVAKGAVLTDTAVIVAIDSTNRVITLKGADGMTDTIVAGPEIQRFSDLKVGDTVTFKYMEAVVYAIQQPGAKPPAPETVEIVRGTGAKPSGAMAQQLTTVVTVQEIDMAVPSITVKRDDGAIVSFKVEDKANLTGVKAGDKVQVTYTRALAVSVEAPKK